MHNWSQYFLIFPCLLLFVCAFRLTYWCWMNINWTLITCFLAPEPRIYMYLRKSLRNVNWAKRRKCRCIRLGAVSKKLNVFTCLFQGRYFLLKWSKLLETQDLTPCKNDLYVVKRCSRVSILIIIVPIL